MVERVYTPHVVPGFFVQAVLAAMRAEDVDVAALSLRAERDLGASDAALLALPVGVFLDVLVHARTLRRKPELGLALGERLSEANLHMLGPLIVASPTLRAAFDNIDALQAIMLSNEGWRLSEHGVGALYGPKPLPEHAGSAIFLELLMTLAYACARRFVGAHHEADLYAHFASPAPAHEEAYRRVFERRVVFAARATGLYFPRALLDLPRPGTDPAFAGTLRGFALARLSGPEADESWTSRLENTLRAHDQLAQIDFARVAALWHVSARTLRRKVEAEGTRLSDVLNRVRFERAKQLLRLKRGTVREISESLGYSEVSSFQRAFKRWAGVGPGEYRERAADQDGDGS